MTDAESGFPNAPGAQRAARPPLRARSPARRRRAGPAEALVGRSRSTPLRARRAESGRYPDPHRRGREQSHSPALTDQSRRLPDAAAPPRRLATCSWRRRLPRSTADRRPVSGSRPSRRARPGVPNGGDLAPFRTGRRWAPELEEPANRPAREPAAWAESGPGAEPAPAGLGPAAEPGQWAEERVARLGAREQHPLPLAA